jgi:7-keto-8-aminopelargonate synthetase-like enzyme
MAVERNTGTRITIDGAEYIYFSGTNYLSLAHRPELLQAAEQAFLNFGFSSSASRITSGETNSLLALEEELAAFANGERAIVLPAGFMANGMVVEGLDDLVDFWIVQKSAHGSIKSAVRASRKPVIVDDGTIAPLKEKHGLPSGSRLGIFCEPVEPMSGNLFDVTGYRRVVDSSDFLVLDEAHSMGVLGRSGKGAVEQFDLDTPDNLVRTGTFSKAIGTYGGFILAPQTLADRLRQVNGYKGSTALSPVLVSATRAALRLIENNQEETVNRLKKNIDFVCDKLVALGFLDYKDHHTPIFSLKSSPATSVLHKALRAEHLFVPDTTGYFTDSFEIGLRWTVQAGHSRQDLDKLLNEIEAGIKEHEHAWQDAYPAHLKLAVGARTIHHQ